MLAKNKTTTKKGNDRKCIIKCCHCPAKLTPQEIVDFHTWTEAKKESIPIHISHNFDALFFECPKCQCLGFQLNVEDILSLIRENDGSTRAEREA